MKFMRPCDKNHKSGSITFSRASGIRKTDVSEQEAEDVEEEKEKGDDH